MSNRGLDVLSREQCDDLLRRTTFGRVAVKLGDTISALPVYYAMLDGDIIFRTDPGTKLAAAVLNTRVTFEIDDEAEGWSVMAVGPCEEIRRADEIETARASLGDRWPDVERQRVVRIRVERVTGRRLRRPD
jgi:nitroimidazol reductase NimA-like FMN-containing flavoprotein (pyridoxamine 5'-phosphate oxidase superfamily)